MEDGIPSLYVQSGCIFRFKMCLLGRLGGTVVERLPSAQGVIPALWDQAPRQTQRWAGSLMQGSFSQP